MYQEFLRIVQALVIQKKLKANHTLSCKMFNIKIRQYLKQMGYPESLISGIDNIVFDDSLIKQKTYDKLHKMYQNKYQESVIDNKIKEKLYQQGFEI